MNPKHDPLDAFLDVLADRIVERLKAREAEHSGAIRWATSTDNPFGKPRPFLDAGRRGDFPTFKRGRETVAVWSDVETYIQSRAIKRTPRPSLPVEAPPAPVSLDERRRAKLRDKGLLPAPQKGAA